MITDDALAATLPKLGPMTTGKTDGRLQRTFIGCGLGHRHASRKQALACRDRWRKAAVARLRKDLLRAEKLAPKDAPSSAA